MKVGAVFNSEEEFVVELKKYEDKSKSIFYKRSSTNIETARKKGVQRHINPSLPYQLLFCCIHGGKKARKQITDNSRNTRTFQKNCPANIRLIVSEDGNHLTIANVNFEHNHETTEALYKHLPQKRKLNPDEKYKVEEFLKAGGNKKKIKHIMECQTNKLILLKDLRNLQYSKKSNNNSLNAVVELLQHTYSAYCEIFVENNIFKGIFFQTEQMMFSMQAYPEFIAVDATYKLLNIRTPVYIILCENSNGGSEIVAVGILVSEDKESMEWFLNVFKKTNPSWTHNRVVMSDKDLLERQVLKDNFPNSNIIICIFHSLKTFNREISCEKLGITPGQRDTAKELFQKMLYSQSDEEYDDLYNKLDELSQSIKDYFNSNWHSIKDEWTLNHNFLENSLNNTTNNRLESINQKLKSVIDRDSSLVDFIENFFLLYHGMLEERDQIAAYEYFKVPLKRFEVESPQFMYSSILTNYAYNYIHKELEQYKKIKKLEENLEENKSYIIQCGSRMIKATANECTCRIRISLMLPCRHIFAVREKEEVSLFDPSLCNIRWTLSHVRKYQRVFQGCNIPTCETQRNESAIITDIGNSEKIKKKKLNKFEKYKKAMLVLRDIASLMSEQSGEHFNLSMNNILKFKDLLLDGKFVQVSELYEDIDNNVVPLKENNDRNEINEHLGIAPNIEINVGIKPDTPTDPTDHQVVMENPILMNIHNITYYKSQTDTSAFFNDHNYCQNSFETPKETPVSSSNLDRIIIPKVVKTRGRPKGCTKTVIGLPKFNYLKKKPFNKITTSEKKLFILQLISPFSKEAFEKKKIIETEDLNLDLPFSLLHCNINLNLVREFCSEASWNKLNISLSGMKNIQQPCVKCNQTLDKSSVTCASCLKSYDLLCLSMKRIPKKRYWMCRYC